MKIKHYLLAVISLVLFQGCLCKHYPFEKLKSEVGEPLHKQIMEYKKANGTYPNEKDKKNFGKFLKNMGCKFQSRIEINSTKMYSSRYKFLTNNYPWGFWKCNKNIYLMRIRYCTGYNYCKSDTSGFDDFAIQLGEFTYCRYQYNEVGLQYTSCNHSPCWSRYTH